MNIGSMGAVAMQAAANISAASGKMAESIEKGAVPAPEVLKEQPTPQKPQAIAAEKGNSLDLKG